MTLKTIAKCTKILKKSQSPAFKDIQVGDSILFSCDIKPSGRWNGKTYATYINCENMRTGEKVIYHLIKFREFWTTLSLKK